MLSLGRWNHLLGFYFAGSLGFLRLRRLDFTASASIFTGLGGALAEPATNLSNPGFALAK